MKYMLIKELYDCFYTPPELSALRQEIEECHKALIEVLEKPERRLVLQIIDAKDRIAEDTSIDSFISGFELAWQLSMELNNYENERLAELDPVLAEAICRAAVNIVVRGQQVHGRIVGVGVSAAAIALHGALILHPALMLLVAPKASGIVLDQQVQALEQAAFMGKCL